MESGGAPVVEGFGEIGGVDRLHEVKVDAGFA
jgi:hypothetical protein